MPTDEEVHDIRLYEDLSLTYEVGQDHAGNDLKVTFDRKGWHFEHTCKSDRREFLVVCAPSLSAHNIMVADAKVTVAPSILCPDCGIHGWVVDSAWVGV